MRITLGPISLNLSGVLSELKTPIKPPNRR